MFLVKTDDRYQGISKLMDEMDKLSGSKVAIKANFNSADPFPASTHIETLRSIIQKLKDEDIDDITIAERSGMGRTRNVLQKMGVFRLADEMDFNVVVLDEMDKDEWVKINKEGNHWFRGFYLPKLLLDSPGVIQTCCLKTHRFGGHFTLSMKNSVGLVAKRLPGGFYDYMAELHVSPNQRKMIAEINQYYPVDFVIMDGIKAFINQGPETGEVVEPNLLIAGNDRVAVDAVGVAVLRNYGVTTGIRKGKIFDQAQIKRAVELKIGVESANEIELVSLNEESKDDADRIYQQFQKE